MYLPVDPTLYSRPEGCGSVPPYPSRVVFTGYTKHIVSTVCCSQTQIGTRPLARLDRALPSEGEGHTFESCRVRHFSMACNTCRDFWLFFGSRGQKTIDRENILPPVGAILPRILFADLEATRRSFPQEVRDDPARETFTSPSASCGISSVTSGISTTFSKTPPNRGLTASCASTTRRGGRREQDEPTPGLRRKPVQPPAHRRLRRPRESDARRTR